MSGSDGTGDVIVSSAAEEEVPAQDIIVLDEEEQHSNYNNSMSKSNHILSSGSIGISSNNSQFSQDISSNIITNMGQVTADEDDDLMDIGESAYVNDQHLMDEEVDGEDEAMQFETVANKMFQSETEVVPLPGTEDHSNTGIHNNSNNNSATQIITLNNSHHMTTGTCLWYTCLTQFHRLIFDPYVCMHR
jgi:hypothetical protein